MNVMIRSVKSLYRLSPVSRGLNRLAQEAYFRWLGRTSDQPVFAKVRVADGRFSMELDLRDRLQFMIWVRAHHERDTEIALRPFLVPGTRFVDVGANVGYYSLLALSAHPDVHVTAFEPSPFNLKRLERNLRINDDFLNRCEVLHAAASATEGRATLYCPDPVAESGWNKLVSIDAENARTEQHDVPLLTLDQTVRDATILKIDVEGHEHEVLKGAHRLLSSRSLRTVCIEINEPVLLGCGSSGQAVDGELKAHGFAPYRIDRGGRLCPVVSPGSESRACNYLYLRS